MNTARGNFEAELAKGSGRAMLLLTQAPDDTALAESLLDACVRDLTYDGQCENGRGPYLARLIAATQRPAWFFDALIRQFQERSLEDEDFHHLQAFSVLTWIAAEHAELDRAAVRGVFEALPIDDQLDCMDDLVRLEGLPTLLDCALVLAAQPSDERWRANGLLEAIREREGPEIDQVLLGLRQEHSALDGLMGRAEADRATLLPDDEPCDFAAVRSGLREGKRPPGAWFRKPSEDEWRQLAEDMAECGDPGQVIPYLRLYGRRPFPLHPSLLLTWIDSPRPRTRGAAIRALSRVRAPLVRELALDRLKAGDASGVDLLAANFEPGDFELIEPTLDADLDTDGMHDLGLAILRLVAEHEPLHEAVPSLLRLYEQTPCSLCRGSAVAHLAEVDGVPAWMAEESRFDADGETVRRFRTP